MNINTCVSLLVFSCLCFPANASTCKEALKSRSAQRETLPILFFQGKMQSLSVSSISSYEAQIIHNRFASDPSLATTQKVIQEVLQGDSPLKKSLQETHSLTSQFLTSYLKWIAHRSKKADLPENDQMKKLKEADIDPALATTNLMEIFDQLIRRLIQAGEEIPEPITRLLMEQLQGGIERTQVAADTFMLNNSIGEIVETLNVLSSEIEVDITQIYKAIMKLSSLDRGAPYVVQRPLSAFTTEERHFFAAIDPMSPLTLPSRTYSDKEIQAIRSAYPHLKFIDITGEQADLAVAPSYKGLLSKEVTEKIQAHYGVDSFYQLSREKIDAALEELGQETLLNMARNSRLRIRRTTSDKNQNGQASTAQELTISSSAFPIAASNHSKAELREYDNTASQILLFKDTPPKIERTLARLEPGSDLFNSGVTLYNTYLHLGMYNPNKLERGHGVYDILALASLEFGTLENHRQVLELIQWRYERILAIRWKGSTNSQLSAYNDTFTALTNFIKTRQTWDYQTLNLVMKKIDWLSDVKDPTDISEDQANSLIQEITQLRRSEKLNTSELERYIEHPSEEASVKYGTLTMKLSVVEISANQQRGKFISVAKLRQTEDGSTEFWHTLENLEAFFQDHGFDGIQYMHPTLHLSRAFKAQNKYIMIESANQASIAERDPNFFLPFRKTEKTRHNEIKDFESAIMNK